MCVVIADDADDDDDDDDLVDTGLFHGFSCSLV